MKVLGRLGPWETWFSCPDEVRPFGPKSGRSQAFLGGSKIRKMLQIPQNVQGNNRGPLSPTWDRVPKGISGVLKWETVGQGRKPLKTHGPGGQNAPVLT